MTHHGIDADDRAAVYRHRARDLVISDTIGDSGGSPVRTTTTTHGMPALLRLVVVAVFLACLVPAMALADDSGTAVMDAPASEAPAPASEAPATDPGAEPAPVEEPAAAAEPEPVAEGSAAPDETPATAPPPSSEAPEPVPAPAPEAEVPVVPEILVPVLEPVLAPTLPELVPVIGAPGDTGARPIVAVVTPVPDALPAPRAPASPGGPLAAVAPIVADAPPAPGLAGALGAPTAPAAGPDAARSDDGVLRPPVREAAQVFGEQPAGAFAAPVADEPPVAPISSLAPDRAAPDPTSFTVQVTAPEGSAPQGSSLLEVLAGYVMPGSGPPASSIIFLVLLGTLLAAIYAPRPQVSERIHLLGLLGPRSGHGMAVRRPG